MMCIVWSERFAGVRRRVFIAPTVCVQTADVFALGGFCVFASEHGVYLHYGVGFKGSDLAQRMWHTMWRM